MNEFDDSDIEDIDQDNITNDDQEDDTVENTNTLFKGSIFLTVFDAVVFTAIAIVFGFLIDFLAPRFDLDEPPLWSLNLVMLQVVVDIIILYIIVNIYQYLFGRAVDESLGQTMFIVIFFLVQIQLFQRLNNVWYHITGRYMVREDIEMPSRVNPRGYHAHSKSTDEWTKL